MSKVRLTWQPTIDPKDAQPNYLDFDTVTEALSRAYEYQKAKGYNAATEIRRDGEVLYDASALAEAVNLMSSLVHLDNRPLAKAAEHVAREDGHLD